MELIRTEQIRIEGIPELSTLCHLSKNLYNEANYIIRQEFFINKRWIRYNEFDKLMQNSENYSGMGGVSAQQTLMLLDRNWIATFAGIKERKMNPEKFSGKVNLPKYKPKDGEFVLVFTNRGAHIRNGYLTFTKKLPLKIKTRLTDDTKLNQVRIIPKSNHYVCEIVYEKLSEEGEINRRWYSKLKNKNRIIGIDLGLRNVVTIANNIGEKPIIIKGGVLKSINQFYNKEKASLQSVYDKQGIKYGSKMDKLNDKRNSKIKDAMHKVSKSIIDYSLAHNIGVIVIGKNDNWKQECNMGKRNNQNFVQIPHYRLIQMITYKAEEQGITVKLQEEFHTSKCSFLDMEPICHQEKYKGTRFTRGLFKSSLGLIINSDVNGALNIIRKAIPNAFINMNVKGIEDVGLHPIRMNPLRSNN